VSLVVIGVGATLAGLYGRLVLVEDEGHHDGRAVTFALDAQSGTDELVVEEAEPGSLTVRIERAGQTITDFDELHGADLHVFVVASDLSSYDHVTRSGPDLGAPIAVSGGRHRLVVQAAPAGGPDLLELGTDVDVGGGEPATEQAIADDDVWTDGEITVTRQGFDVVLSEPWDGVELSDGPADLFLFGGPEIGFVHDHAELVGDDRFSFAVDLPGLGDYLAVVEFDHAGERRTALFRFTL
jgi:hypothetical protein